MYMENAAQCRIEPDFDIPFTMKLDPNNRWVRLAHVLPWEDIEDLYTQRVCTDNGRPAYPARLAFAVLFIRYDKGLSQRRTIEELQENPYLQYFAGVDSFHELPDIDPSSLVDFEKRFPADVVEQINERMCLGYMPEHKLSVDRDARPDKADAATTEPAGSGAVPSGNPDAAADSSGTSTENADQAAADGETSVQTPSGTAETSRETPPEASNSSADSTGSPDHTADAAEASARTPSGTAETPPQPADTAPAQPKNRGKLLIDATVAPQGIRYPTDIGILNECREDIEKAIDIFWPFVPHNTHKFPYSKGNARKQYLNISKAKRCSSKKMRKGIEVQLNCIRSGLEQLDRFRAQAPQVELPSWLEKRLKVIPEVYSQQKMMFDTNTHRCDDRIVSLSQPYVRPIVRGKKPQGTEFGMKVHTSVVDGFTFLEMVSWSNYNEGSYLQEVVESYRNRHGFYPEAVLADELYRTKANRAWCRERGIRLSGRPLGRRAKDDSETPAEKKQAYEDSCERNGIEGRYGNLKTRYSMGELMCRLDETSKTEVAFDVLVMNANHLLRVQDRENT